MTLNRLFFFGFLLMCQSIGAQNDSIHLLKEVVVSDCNLFKNNKSQSIVNLNDSIINKNKSFLSELLNYNSVIYFKEYGRGMLSTVSFRGTTASQTAVIWNGININSQLNGITDFNTITATNFNSITVKAGGGSVGYGSGAIGGTVHLNNYLTFKNEFNADVKIDYGSFNTLGAASKILFSNNKWTTQIAFDRNSSTNDYDYINKFTWRGVQRKNLNGQYRIESLNFNFGYKINSTAIIKFYSQTSVTDRHFSLVSESENKTKYINSFVRNLIEYEGLFKGFTTNLKTAYIIENFKYYQDIETDDYTLGNTASLITKLNVGYDLPSNIKISGILDYNNTKGEGSSLGNNTRQIGSMSLQVNQQLTQKWKNELGIKQEVTTNYKSPLLYSVGSSYTFNEWYNLKANFSRNFRIPTFNDLYWNPGGNTNLKPESSYQAEVGNVFTYKKITLSNTVYYNKIKDLIQWVPGNSSFWSPQNIAKVDTYGTEFILDVKQSIGAHHFSINVTYASTISKNRETKKQLFFVPFNKFTGGIAYSYKKVAVNYQFLHNGFVFTRSDNNPKEIIKAYQVSNIGLDYDFRFLNSSKIGFQVFNVFNTVYQSVEDRPLPGRNFNMYIILKFN